MAQPLGLPDVAGGSPSPSPLPAALLAGKKKGCRKHKCSKWKGGKCRCGRD